jgi:thiol-disulfide isomerase/thioredoxin
MKKLLLSFIALGAVSFAQAQIQGYSLGQTVADFTVTDTDGNTHNLYTITSSGKFVLLDFFFDTCPPCQQTQPHFNHFHEKYGCNQGNVFVISINNGTDTNAEVIAFENTYGGPYAHSPAVGIEGGCTPVAQAFNPAAYPTYCLVGPNNTLLNSDIWPISSVASFEAAFPNGSITPMACSGQPTAITEQNNIKVLALFPNPAEDVVYITLQKETESVITYNVVNILGELVMDGSFGKVNTVNSTLDVHALSTGSYFVQFFFDGQIGSTQKLIKR